MKHFACDSGIMVKSLGNLKDVKHRLISTRPKTPKGKYDLKLPFGEMTLMSCFTVFQMLSYYYPEILTTALEKAKFLN